MSCYYIVGVRLDNRVDNAAKFQEVLTRNGCKIKTRLGLHEVSDGSCLTTGLSYYSPMAQGRMLRPL